jgi:2',3'-cyclic-nucleotide 2'-phosphodiesterase (5'-nucleotidase family)
MKRLFSYLWIVLLLLGVNACTTYYAPSKLQWKDYRVAGNKTQDSALLQLLKPYSDSINSTMNGVIAEVAETLEKKQPDGALGQVLTDAMREMAEKKFNTKVHGAFINNGGIRLPVLPKGPLTTGKVYELMPFDNLLVLQQLSGRQLKELLDHIAKRGGWPASGITYDIRQQQAVNIRIGGEPFDENGTYTIGNSDFIANGGDDCVMLKTIQQQNRNILLRDVFIEYFSGMQAQGRKITAPAGVRVRNIQ